ncbi:hypothetical protein DVA86_27255 [Streptomyces armeniacus]|uniref:Bacterial transcriptional activator domain-containing protein n=1 Tax=Streptomyces armeniacus TaxID=83291 RepID=A0A345XVW2_9ACTN|nr:BTAD domain-containing putative transcriptional regulator [Streptomyces armeniacus]AXK35778.1 hypothetical protein DVA86_27255 [Streptomyces armeniacus]
MTIAPVVRALRLAHDHAHPPADGNGDTTSALPESHDHFTGRLLPSHHGSVAPPQGGRVVAVTDGRAVALDLARTRGLGLVGPGAPDALRALAVSLLTERRHPRARDAELLVPATDAQLLLSPDQDATVPPTLARLRLVDTLDATLDTMEAELLTRTRTAAGDGTEPASDAGHERELVLIASPAPHAQRRLQALLDNGSTLGITGVLLGQWRPGATAHVRADGTVSATSDSLAGTLAGSRLFTLPALDCQVLLDLLTEADDAAVPQPEPQLAAVPGSGPVPDFAPPAHPAQSVRTSDSGRVYPLPAAGQSELELAQSEPEAPPASVRQAEEPANTPGVRGSSSTESARRAERTSGSGEEHASYDAATSGPDNAVTIDVLGNLHVVHHHGDHHQNVTAALAPRQRDVLTFLALHPEGVRRETLAVTLWPDAPADRPYNALHATLSQLRRALRTATDSRIDDLIVHHDGHYALNRDQGCVDLWQLRDALHAARPENRYAHRLEAVRRIDDLYHGDLANDLSAEWIEAPREALRRDVLDALSTLAHTVADTDPEEALRMLERARELDPYNEALYQDIARLQARLGRHDAIPRTLALLTTTLAELDEQPSPQTVTLCESLHRARPADSRGQADG